MTGARRMLMRDVSRNEASSETHTIAGVSARELRAKPNGANCAFSCTSRLERRRGETRGEGGGDGGGVPAGGDSTKPHAEKTKANPQRDNEDEGGGERGSSRSMHGGDGGALEELPAPGSSLTQLSGSGHPAPRGRSVSDPNEFGLITTD